MPHLSKLVILFMLVLMFCCRTTPEKKLEADDEKDLRIDSPSGLQPVIHSQPHAVAQRITTIFNVSADTLWDDSLKKYFSHPQIAQIKQAKAEFEHISRADELASFYHFTIPEICAIFGEQVGSPEELEMGDNSPGVKWAWFTEYFPLVYGDVLCLDCVYSPMNELAPLVKLAARTPGNEDDLFLDLAIAANGGSRYDCSRDFFYASGWFATNECDICRASLLGDGKRIILIEKLKKAESARSLFGPDLHRISEQIFSFYDSNYLYSKEKVLAEIEKILSSPLLTPEEKNRIQDQVKEIKTKSQFNCSSYGSCRWG